jgi:two-component system NtrC family response regulator
MPPLRDRAEDILILAHHFLQEETQKIRREQVSFSPGTMAAMIANRWPGNVRELQSRIRRALGTTTSRIIQPSDLGLEDARMDSEEQKLLTLKQARETAEIKSIQRALALSGNNISQAARLLEISRPTLHDLLSKHDIVVL